MLAPLYVHRDALPRRVVVLGDLNAQATLLERYLRGLRLLRRDGHWGGRQTVLVQMGDVVNRGPGARRAMDLLMRLRPEAQAEGGDVVWLLGNHEVMSVLQYEAHVSADEYLEFATPGEVAAFSLERARKILDFSGPPDRPQRVDSLEGRLLAWEAAHVPGKDAYRAAMSANGVYGAHIRRLPVVCRMGPLVFVHGGLSPGWASLGLEGLGRKAAEAWATHPTYYQDLDPRGIFRDPVGPLWHRAYCVSTARVVRADAALALASLGAEQMIVGHTRTDSVIGGEQGRPLVRLGGRVIMSDTSMGAPGEPGSALVIEGRWIERWSVGGAKGRVAERRR
ncbi:MAG: metallophosphoesterase [Deltaproteobacteria bacterium]|nr:metallophosphoesterase [Deltaproteobacteria bacterium]